MDSQEVIRNAIRSAGRLARRVEAVARAEEAAQSVSLTEAEEAQAKASEDAADARVSLRICEQFLWIPVVRGRALRRARSDLEKARADAKAAQASIRLARAGINRWAEVGSKAAVSIVRLTKALRAAPELGTPPLATERAADELRSRLDMLAGRPAKGRWAYEASSSCEAVIELVRDWAKAKVEADKKRKEQAAQARRLAPVAAPARRIYLPIPPHLGPQAERLGARRDEQQQRGVSPWSVGLDQDLSKFNAMLPLAYRKQAPAFEFPPIPLRAAGQNLWGVFDKESWDHVRSSAYGLSGRRCMVCGGRGGFIADKVLGPEERRHGVDCHEVWDWDVEDPATGVGVQRLKQLLVVCVSCHATFHSGHFARVGAAVGLEAEVREHIEKRRMLINRVSREALDAQLAETREAFSGKTGVDRWILDLEHLAGQQFMAGRELVMVERNAAGLSAERIAGVAFETDAGVAHPARSAQEIYDDLTAGQEYDGSNVVRLGR